MKSPFPSMNPYLEGDLWPDVHHSLITKIRKFLVPLISPKYVARVERYVVEDDNPQSELGIIYPDVEILLNQVNAVKEPALAYGREIAPTPSSLSVPVYTPIKVNIPVLKIIDIANNQLITAIEILSPVNKRKPGLAPYLKKRLELYKAGVHFLEIDLLRRGHRTIKHAQLADTDYLVALTRADKRHRDIWKIGLRTRLPIIPVPLMPSDGDVLIDLQQALVEGYEEAGYHLGIDYSKNPPPPSMSKEDSKWIKEVISAEKK